MTEWRLFDGDLPHVSTFEFHEHRERAPHLEQADHRERLLKTARLVRQLNPASVVDLGCGDGGLLSLIKDIPSWGYDWHPASAQGWEQRGITAEHRDVFGGRDVPRWGQVAVLTEVLEHVADPHGVVEWVSRNAEYVVASSPRHETGERHGDCHAWAWDEEGYASLFAPHFEVLEHIGVAWSQIIAGRSRNT
ncbi:methyltransferase domain-containing protein [Acrocarpospora sp. B8E8]|uniref:methyltransferase domain-containing protein n=1 Tax=Acrocarpospora sp. B8E8 TaxID=3153572 RepID=UPI00325D602F